MDSRQYHTITSRDLRILNPISSKRLDQFLNLIELAEGSRVLDMACGKGEVLVRLAQRQDIHGVGVDLSSDFIAEARRQNRLRVSPRERLEFFAMPGEEYRAEEPFHLVICMGASWIYGGFEGALIALEGFLRPGGLLVMGDCHWKSEPDPEYLEQAGYKKKTFGTCGQQVEGAGLHGLTPLYVQVSTEEEWDHYEWMRVRAAELHGMEQPDHEETGLLLDRARRGRDLYLKWGRHTLGWALYLFIKN